MAHITLLKNCQEAPNIVLSGMFNPNMPIPKECLVARLKDDKSVMFLYRRAERSIREVLQQRKLCLQILSWCEGCRIQSSLLNEAVDILAMTRSVLLHLLHTKDWFRCERRA